MRSGYEQPASILGELADGSYDVVADAEQAVVLKPGATPGDPGSLGLGVVGTMAAVLMDSHLTPRPAAVAVYWLSLGLDGLAPDNAEPGDQLWVEA